MAVLFFLVLLIAVHLMRGTEKNHAVDSADIDDPDLRAGRELSLMYCNACHVYPEPSLLPKSTWRFETLPAMAPFMGVDPFTGGASERSESVNPYIPDNIYPSGPLVTAEQWQAILDFYWQASPEELQREENIPEIVTDSIFFASHIPEFRTGSEPIVTAVAFDQENYLLYISNATDLSFYVFDSELDMVHQSSIESPIAQFSFKENVNDQKKNGISTERDFLATFIGHLYPSDAPFGSVRKGRYNPIESIAYLDSVIVDQLRRPVGSQYADINGDGTYEIIINEFGHRTGSLFWLKNVEGDGALRKHNLIGNPGCIQTYVTDFTGNGKKDVISLCAQTDQAIYLFENMGENEFERSTLLQFEITAGSSSFEVVDFNGNGLLDILYTSGDNADYSKIFKPYHGVYIFLNDGVGSFNQEWFFPLNGAYNAKARDFNGNGLLDIAVISFFADYENSPEEGFVLFKNAGNFQFTPYHHPATGIGRWLTMDVADWNGNGKYDILLGNSAIGVFGASDVPEEQRVKWENGPLFMVLKNRMH